MNRTLAQISLVVVLAFCLAGCGKKGAPGAPKDEINTYPRSYPYDATKAAKTPDPTAMPPVDPGNTNSDPSRSAE